MTPTTLHLLSPTLGSKVTHPLSSITKLFVSPYQDGLLVLSFKGDPKGDLVLVLNGIQTLGEIIGRILHGAKKTGGTTVIVEVSSQGQFKVGLSGTDLTFVKEPIKKGIMEVKKVGKNYQVSVA